ncbi:hypothetical protein CNBF3570 [Cryptococcus deneoformans B-3501A]|uniref:Small ribosomal subunit protein mS41 n=1 Tax=Cryptococcus deneoformans (strain JEC21 / ATCC MYA-565) TaxID=214684 RepID=Q5KFN5_CRYD1|nr:expressed protein [Cryptococcus neoformans var. neoformans JEC21]XP_774678.1 hypothetical protein CNBF3570 [Cryptococcus neoformans var. neoformans B-3501A]AAW44260.2 expressed protein [Cryptococcus neoformans var. neoformans JEC21]EAL20031.1 hypothetical protein CNBF3570 [Cryptococcus neoformans var. neoformans B-3501A]
MMFLPSLRASSSRLAQPRLFSTTSRVLQKAPLAASPEAATPEELLGKIGRNADKKLTPFAESWDKLNEVWLKTKKMNDLGLATKEKRYILWAFSRYSQGSPPSAFIRPPKPPKKFRGWGPKIQHGVRVRD